MGKNQKNKKQAKPASKAGAKGKKTVAKAKASKPASKIKPKAAKGKVVKVVKKAKPVRSAASKAVAKKKVIKNTKVNSNKSKATVKKVKPTLKKSATKAAKSAKKVVKKLVKPVKSAVKKQVKSKVSKPVKTVKAKKIVAKPKKQEKIKAVKPVKVEKKKEVKPSKVQVVKDVKKPIDAIALPKNKPEKVKKGKGGRKPKKKDGDEDEPEIGDDAFIEEIIKSVKPQRNQPKQPKIIKTFINPMTSLTPVETAKKGIPKKEPKGKFELEYVVRTSAGILYEFLSSPSGLSEWFADDVNIRDGIFTFFWDGSEQKAKLLALKEEKFIRLAWVDKPDGYYFEFRIEKDELTSDISLIIVDFADEASDEQTSKLLWDTQVNKLLHVIGSF